MGQMLLLPHFRKANMDLEENHRLFSSLVNISSVISYLINYFYGKILLKVLNLAENKKKKKNLPGIFKTEFLFLTIKDYNIYNTQA